MNINQWMTRCLLCGQPYIGGEPQCVHCEFCGHLKGDRAGIWDRTTGDWFCNVRCKTRHLRFSEVWRHRADLQASVSRGLINAACHFSIGED